MCEFSEKLLAWLDRELSDAEAAGIDRHLQACAECRARLSTYRQISGEFDGYCDALAASQSPSKPAQWLTPKAAPSAAVVVSAGVVAAALALALFFPRQRAKQLPAPQLAPSPALSAILSAASPLATQPDARVAPAVPVNPAHRIRRHHAPSAPESASRAASSAAPATRHITTTPTNTAAAQIPALNPLPPQPAIEIAIPADAMFPPGAVPDGMTFVADVTLAPDGSAERLRLQPRLIEFERRPTRP